LGGLFAAQQNQLNQLLPTLTAPTTAQGIGSGQFGSLRSQTATDTAAANALANLQAQQMTSALQNQQAGAQAGSALGSVGAQGITSGLNTAAAQMNAPFQGLTNYANLVNAVQAPATVSQQTQLSPLQTVQTLAGIPTTATGLLNSLFGQGAGTPGTSGYIPPGLLPTINQIFGPTGNDTSSIPTTDYSSVVDSSAPTADQIAQTTSDLSGSTGLTF
jgi:hypothetical protein